MSLDGFVHLIFNVYEAFTVALFIAEDDHLFCASALSFSKSFDKTRLVPIDGTLPGWAAKHREALIIGNFDKDEETLGYYGKQEEIKSFMAYPLDTPGVIVVDSKKKWVFTEKEKKILAHFVSVLSTEVEREKQLREMEEEREELFLTRRVVGLLRERRADWSALEEVLKEGLSVAGADLVLVGVESRGRLKVISAVGNGAEELVGMEVPQKESIVSMVIEGGREFLLPYESGFLREKPLLVQNDGLRVKQFFGFPLMLDERPYGFVGFASLSLRRLREGVISVLRDTSVLISLYLGRSQILEEMEVAGDRDPISGTLRFGLFFARLEEMAHKNRDFALVSVRLSAFGDYNRSLGIGRVDDMLRRMHQGIAYCMGKNAIITRSGGGHFYVALRRVDVPEGESILNILKFTVLGNLTEEIGATKRGIELGAAYFPRDSDDLWKLMDIAQERGKGNVT
jgi:GGDEF domain-containing protein